MAVVPLLLPLLLFLHQPLVASLSDSGALLLLKSSFINPDPALSSWSEPDSTSSGDATSSPCNRDWTGVLCFRGIVTGIRLGGLGLSGTIDVTALSHLHALRSVSFINNNLSGPLPDIGRLDALKSIYLSNNRFSGPINDSLFYAMDHLKKLWIDGNALSGTIPSSLSKAAALIELRLERNAFSGAIPSFNLSSLRSFNASFNNLQGPIPPGLARFHASAFTGNPKLCGPPLTAPHCPILQTETVEPNPAQVPATESNIGKVALLVLGMLLLFLSLVIGCALVNNRQQVKCAKSEMDHNDDVTFAEAAEVAAAASPVHLLASANSSRRGKQQFASGVPKRGSSSRGSIGSFSKGSGGGGSSRGAELVIVNDEKGVFGLPHLMRAAAEVLGNGGLGSVYKAVMANGSAVAVKRMRDLNRLNKEGFERELKRFGLLRHPNVLTPIAYHYRKEEKLVVSEFIPRGSLLYVLHGDRGADRTAADWPTRLKIIRGIARGMAYLHGELASYELPHGNLKTGNVLLAADFEPLLTDYGLIALANPSAATNALFAYKSPEAPHFSHKSDVFCFGVVLLEILTGKFPSQYLNNTTGGTDVVQWASSAVSERREADLPDPKIISRNAATSSEMVSLLRLGVACTQVSPDERPSMKEAAELVEHIAAGADSGDDVVDAAEPIVPVPAWRDGYTHRSGSSRGSSVGRSQGSRKAAPEQWSGDLLSL